MDNHQPRTRWQAWLDLSCSREGSCAAPSYLDRIHYRRVSFYPLFPTPLDLSHEVNLDVSHLEHLALCHKEGASAPDVLITPSRLKHFSKARQLGVH
jgi:DNA polymerase alpha subunit B